MAAGQSASGRFGARYADGTWSQIRSYTDDQTYQPPSLAVQAAAKANVRAQLNIEVYDLAGPYVYGDLYIRGEGELVDATGCWGLYAGIAGGFGGQIDDDVFGEDLQLPELQLLEIEVMLAEDPVPHTPCGEPSPPAWVGTVSVNRDLFWYSEQNTTGVDNTESATWTLTRRFGCGARRRGLHATVQPDAVAAQRPYPAVRDMRPGSGLDGGVPPPWSRLPRGNDVRPTSIASADPAH